MTARQPKPAEQLWAALLRVHAQLVPLLDSELQAASGLPLGWYDVLLELNAAPGRQLRMGDLGQRVVLSRTRVSRLVDELVDQELVARVPNPDDGRSAFAAITDKGRQVLRRAAPTYLASIDRHVGDAITEAQTRQATKALEAILAANEQSRQARRRE